MACRPGHQALEPRGIDQFDPARADSADRAVCVPARSSCAADRLDRQAQQARDLAPGQRQVECCAPDGRANRSPPGPGRAAAPASFASALRRLHQFDQQPASRADPPATAAARRVAECRDSVRSRGRMSARSNRHRRLSVSATTSWLAKGANSSPMNPAGWTSARIRSVAFSIERGDLQRTADERRAARAVVPGGEQGLARAGASACGRRLASAVALLRRPSAAQAARSRTGHVGTGRALIRHSRQRAGRRASRRPRPPGRYLRPCRADRVEIAVLRSTAIDVRAGRDRPGRHRLAARRFELGEGDLRDRPGFAATAARAPRAAAASAGRAQAAAKRWCAAGRSRLSCVEQAGAGAASAAGRTGAGRGLQRAGHPLGRPGRERWDSSSSPVLAQAARAAIQGGEGGRGIASPAP